MILIADQKRRVVLPKPVKPGDCFEVVELGGRVTLTKLEKPAVLRPPVSSNPLVSGELSEIDLDEPAFDPVSDESPS